MLVPTWFTGTTADHAYLVSKNLLSPEKYYIVMVDALANGISTSPSNSKTQPDDSFPQITITDMVTTQHRLLTEVLGIQSLHSVVGLSMGGMQAFEWAVRYPGFAKKTVAAIGMLGFVPTKLEQQVAREDAVSTIISRSKSRTIASLPPNQHWSLLH